MDLGLKPAYMQRSSAFNLTRQLLCLPFLPAQHIRPTFLKFAEHERSFPDLEKRNRLMDYISRQWLDHPIFDVASWSVFGYQIRTNNDVEGYHHRLNSRAGHRGLTFYRLVPVLLSECQHAQRHATLIASGSNDGTNRGRQYRHLSQKVKDLFEKYSACKLTTTHYLRACGKLYGPPDTE
ncbi:uncharacterized protein LOC127849719 [Dreissena polymorpha]|uniref:uncharacterized protein LOC127849719 n=1 Tax=Dreissena polymorpha TaxID=45954 RepID=UPI00226462BD|nr:uncharacterized protein LOC127849719 [Dreissena polymorpha]